MIFEIEWSSYDEKVANVCDMFNYTIMNIIFPVTLTMPVTINVVLTLCKEALWLWLMVGILSGFCT